MTRFTTIAGAVLVAVAAAGWIYADHLDGRVDDLTRDLREAVDKRQAAERAIVVLADEQADADRRARDVQSSRESIIAAPATDDGPVAPVLHQALEAADRIGGVQ